MQQFLGQAILVAIAVLGSGWGDAWIGSGGMVVALLVAPKSKGRGGSLRGSSSLKLCA